MEESKNIPCIFEDYVNNQRIVTSFLSLDHRHDYEVGEPLVFETIIFGNDEDLDQYKRRWSSYDKAFKGHRTIVKAVRRKYENKEKN